MYKQDAFLLGENFHRVAHDIIPDDLFENEEDDGHWFVPAVVNMAFACELYLKSMLSEGDNEIRGHDLSLLFEKLDEKTRALVLNSKAFKGDDEFTKRLEEAKRLFEEWRYCFEDNKSVSVDIVFLGEFASALHDIAETEVTSHDQL